MNIYLGSFILSDQLFIIKLITFLPMYLHHFSVTNILITYKYI